MGKKDIKFENVHQGKTTVWHKIKTPWGEIEIPEGLIFKIIDRFKFKKGGL